MAATLVVLGAVRVVLADAAVPPSSDVVPVGDGDVDVVACVVLVDADGTLVLVVGGGVGDGPAVGLGVASLPPPR